VLPSLRLPKWLLLLGKSPCGTPLRYWRAHAMFLPKDFLDEPAAGATMPHWNTSGATPSASSASVPGTNHAAVASSLEDELEATPSSAAGLRQKMMQQRQRALAKQRTAGQITTGSMVMANETMPAPESAPAAKSPVGAQAGGERAASSSSACAPAASSGFPLLDQVMSRMSADDDEEGGLVMPDPAYVEVSKEEEARRRNSLTQDLDERGICHVFDPLPTLGSSGIGNEGSFDLASIGPSEMKPFILNPAPKTAGMIECRIIREKHGLNKLFPKYTLESDAGVFIMTAKKQKHNKTSNYAISTSREDPGTFRDA